MSNLEKKDIFLLILILFVSCKRGEVSEYKVYLNHNDTVKYVGKQQCRMCHAEIYDSYINTGMGRSFHYATKEYSVLSGSKMDIVHDTIKNLSYKPFWRNDSLYLLEYRIKENDLFVSPIDISDHNIPNGNSIFLLNCKKKPMYILFCCSVVLECDDVFMNELIVCGFIKKF